MMDIPLLELATAAERRLRSLAAHEAGHWTVAHSFGLDPLAFLGGLRSGICRASPGTAFQNCAFAWGGIIGEDVLGFRHPERTLPTCQLTVETFRTWLAEMLYDGMKQVQLYSEPDVTAIKDHPRWLEAAQLAFQILASRRDLLAWKTDQLVEAFRPRVHRAMLRNDFRADEQDCLAVRR